MTASLANRSFLITRPANQSERLSALLREAGAHVLLAPMIEIEPPGDPDLLDAMLARLNEFDLVVFISPTAIDSVAALIDVWPDAVAVAVIGPSSQESARKLGASTIISPAERFDSEGLLACPELQVLTGKHILLVRGNGGRELLQDTLTARGAEVEIVEAYRRRPPSMAASELAKMVGDGVDGIIVTSSEAVENLFGIATNGLAERVSQQMFFASHARIADAVRQHGVGRIALTAAGDAGILATLNEFFSVPMTSTPALPQPAAAIAVSDTSRQGPPHRHWPWAIGTVLASLLGASAITSWQTDVIENQTRQQLNQLTSQFQLQTQRADHNDISLRQDEARLATLETRNEDLIAQQSNLKELYGVLSGSHETALLADAELTLALASQQLQLTGNVSAALSALYRLDERLAGFDAGALLPVRRAVARDIDTLKRIPYVDLVGLSARIDALAAAVDSLPLVVDAASTDETTIRQAPATKENWLSQSLNEIVRSMRAVIEIRRIDRPDPVLLAPEQALYLREHVKLRLLNARLALLQHDQPGFQQDLVAADALLRRYFDRQTKAVRTTLSNLDQLMQQKPAIELPTLADSLAAVKDARRVAQHDDEQGAHK